MQEPKLYDLTIPQKSIWITEEYYKGTSINNICGSAFIKEQVDFDILHNAILTVMNSNDIFCVKFTPDSSSNLGIKQFISNDKKPDIIHFCVKNLDELDSRKSDIASTPIFALNSFCYNFYTFELPNGYGGFMLNIHHILADSWTLGLMSRNIVKAYCALKNGNNFISDNSSYLDYILSENNYKHSDRFAKDKIYWNNDFDLIPDLPVIPGNITSKNELDDCSAKRNKYFLDKLLLNKINDFCKLNHITLYNFFMTVFAFYISNISCLNDFVIGTPILNRTNFIEKHTAGMFVNMAPLKLHFGDSLNFLDCARSISLKTLNLMKHQKYSYQTILEDLHTSHNFSGSLYNFMFSYQITSAKDTDIPLIYETDWTFNGNCSENLDVQIFDINDSGVLSICYDYRTSVYSSNDIDFLHNRIVYIIEQILDEQNIVLDDIDIITPMEKSEILNDFNNSTKNFENIDILSLFKHQVSLNKDKTAVISNGVSLSFAELDEKSTFLAKYLKKFGVCENTIVGIMVNRSVELAVGLLAIIKCGATYLPLDFEYPKNRIDFMLNDSNTNFILVSSNTFSLIDNKCKINIDLENTEIYGNTNIGHSCSFLLKPNFTPHSLAYIIYTSGSTGNPKGVKISYGNLGNFVNAMNDIVEFDNKTVVSVTTVCFDIFGLEFWCSMCFGSTLVIANEDEQKTPNLLNELCLKHDVSLIQTTPSRFSTILDDLRNCTFFKNISCVLVGGESLTSKVLTDLKNVCNGQIFNVYGPTETTIWSTFKDLTFSDSINIGKPIANNYVYVMNQNKKLLPKNTPGLLYIGGLGVSNGYINNLELTSERYISSPFIDNSRIYNTNDLAFFNDNGDLVCLGRNDFQVKIHGFRVELGEIESLISKIDDISNCVVCLKNLPNKSDVLVAYFTSKSTDYELCVDKIKNNISKNLPYYMMPNYFVKLDSFSYTYNGKIDRKLLPLPSFDNYSKKIVLPRNDVDKHLIEILEDLLDEHCISISDSLQDLGADSLDAINFSTKVYSFYSVQLSIRDLLNNISIKDISDFIQNSNINSDLFLKKADTLDFYPLSSAQKRIYYNTKLIGDKSTLYNMPGYVLFDEIIDIQTLEDRFNIVINNNCAFRTSFVINCDEIVQKIADSVEFHIPVFEDSLSNLDNILHNFSKPFNLECAPLLRVEVYYLDNCKTLLLFESHHIIMDGTSFNLLFSELSGLPANKDFDYYDYAVWENNFCDSNNILPYEKYWLDKFEDCEFSELNLPYDFNLTNKLNYDGNYISISVDDLFFDKISRFALKHNVSSYVFLLSAFYVLLYKYSYQNDITVGVPFANRQIAGTSNMIGMFVNTLVTRGIITDDMDFEKFMNFLANQELDDISYGLYPFDLLIKKLGVSGNSINSPLFDVMFIYQNQWNSDGSVSWNEIRNNTSKYNLTLEVNPKLKKIGVEYKTSLFKADTINTFLKHYLHIVDVILNDVNVKIKDISPLSEIEINSIVYGFNNTFLDYCENKTIYELFEEQVEKTPDSIAVVFGDEYLTYYELNAKANQLANFLRNSNVLPNDFVGIMLSRSLDLIIAIIGVLKAGGCYIPIDPTYPEKRIDYMLKNSNAKFVITSEELSNSINYSNKICISDERIFIQDDSNLECVNSCDDLAYLIYTSGSTGLPKGVMLKHKNVTNLAFASNECIEFLKDNCLYKNMVSVTTVSFDIFVFETLICLQKGLKIVIANEDEQRIPSLLNSLIEKNNVQMIQTTPSIMQILIDNINDIPFLSNLHYVNLIGEPLSLRLRDDLLKFGINTIYNEYGPTETTVFSSVSDATYLDEIHVGKPIANTQMYILDYNLNPVPIGVSGELYIAGDGVGKGYLNRDDENKKRFLPNPFLKNSVMYKTGDLCKYDSFGNIYHLGRIDNQIKIRGLRIELGEIENKILDFKHSIKKALVVKQNIGNREIISAYFTASKKVNITELRSFLYSVLPKYMVPSFYTPIEDFPYTPNGKIDRNALPIPDGVLSSSSNVYVAPQSELEIKLVSIWEDILNTKPIGIRDNFFELGGDSVLAMNLTIRLLKFTNNIKYADIFSSPTIEKLCAVINSGSDSFSDDNLEMLKDEYSDILRKNMFVPTSVEKHDIGNIVITGATGFLGIHVLKDFLYNENGKAYVIIRKDVGVSVYDKFLDKLHYYFGDDLDKFISSRIFIIEGDITKDGFGLNQEDLFNLGNDVDSVVNCAAKVSHYGNYNDFYNTNVKSVKNIIDFANAFNTKIYHISTLSVSGNAFVDHFYMEQHFSEKINFSEDCFYIGQNLDNLYVRSKFEAEKLLFDAILHGTEAHILRVGNLMPRFSDGVFQNNVSENAYINRLKAFFEMKTIPNYLLNMYLELTPIDCTASAIIKIMQFAPKENIVFHLFNHKYIYLKNLLLILKEINIDIKTVSDDDFRLLIKNLLADSNSNVLGSLVNDIDKDLNLNYDSNIKLVSEHSIYLLKLFGFEWPDIDVNYVKYIIKLLNF